jgi:hypothetical protein
VLFPRVLSVSDSAIRIPHLIWASFPIDDQYDSYELILSRMEKGEMGFLLERMERGIDREKRLR